MSRNFARILLNLYYLDMTELTVARILNQESTDPGTRSSPRDVGGARFRSPRSLHSQTDKFSTPSFELITVSLTRKERLFGKKTRIFLLGMGGVGAFMACVLLPFAIANSGFVCIGLLIAQISCSKSRAIAIVTIPR